MKICCDGCEGRATKILIPSLLCVCESCRILFADAVARSSSVMEIKKVQGIASPGLLPQIVELDY